MNPHLLTDCQWKPEISQNFQCIFAKFFGNYELHQRVCCLAFVPMYPHPVLRSLRPTPLLILTQWITLNNPFNYYTLFAFNIQSTVAIAIVRGSDPRHHPSCYISVHTPLALASSKRSMVLLEELYRVAPREDLRCSHFRPQRRRQNLRLLSLRGPC